MAIAGHLRRFLLQRQLRLVQVLPIQLLSGWAEKRGRAEETDDDNDNWDDFPINHYMDAPCVEDLNPSRNFHTYFSILLATYLTITYEFQFLLESKITTTQGTPK